MKILIVQNTDWIKRYPAQQHHLAEMLSLRGHEIRVIDYEILWRMDGRRKLYSRRRVFNNVHKTHNDARVTVIHAGIIRIPWLDYASLVFSQRREINRQMREFAPDVIVGMGGIFSYLAGKAAERNNLPFINYWIDVTHRLIPSKLLQPVGWIIEHGTLKMADKVLVINDKLRDYVTKIGAPPQRTQVLRAGIDNEQFSPKTSGSTVRKQYGFSEKDLVLFFMGWLYNFSGLKEVALELAQKGNRNIKLFIVGEGDAYDELQKIGEKYSLQDRIILTGKKPYEEIPAFIAASDICLLPAYPAEKIMHDIVPIKMYEYMAMKKPVIATRLPGVMKEFGKGNGVVYVERPEDAVGKALELAANGSLGELGSRARAFVERYGWKNITDEFERILEEAIKEKGEVKS